MYSLKKIGHTGPKILLLHGLYSSAGAWISVLRYFKEFQVTLVHIDYHAAIADGVIPDMVAQISSDLCKKFDVAIGHSFGCFFLHLLGLKTKNNIYIAPPFLAKEFAFEKYLDFIVSKTKMNPGEVALVVRRAIGMNEKFDLKHCDPGKILLPSSDEFFSYADDSYPVRYFLGTHSDVDAAINFSFSENLILC